MTERLFTSIPSEVRDGPPPLPGSLPVGSPGKLGQLELTAEYTGNRTEVVRRRTAAPLHLMRPLYTDPALPSVPICYVISSGGGIVGGDRLTNSITVGPSAHLVVTTQAATKIHRSDGGHAAQEINIEVGPGAICEWVPDAAVPFAGSRFHQICRAQVDETGVLVLIDIVTAGRVGHGEIWALGAYLSSVEVTRPDGLPVLIDSTRLVGREGGGGPVVAGDATVIGTCMVVAPGDSAVLAGAMRKAFTGAAVSTLPDQSGAWLRILGDSVEEVQKQITAAWSAARQIYAGVPAPPLRKT